MSFEEKLAKIMKTNEMMKWDEEVEQGEVEEICSPAKEI